ncbi:MAG TPA: septum site-determining protein MinC, partial [Burkholderiaceae bacterium]|nr:septum site-determining protein MinC [Burkholderiaceae bacterium]
MAEPSGRARARFDLKRTTFPLFSLVLRTTDLAELQGEFQARLGDSPEFFDQDLLVLNLSAVQREDEDLDFDGLVAMLRRYGLQPIGAHGGSAAQMAAAAQAGLVPTPEVSVASSMARAEARAQTVPVASSAAQAG